MSHEGVWEIGGKMEVERWGDGRRIAADTSAGRYTLWLQDACCRDVDLRVDTHHHRIHGRALRRHLSPGQVETARVQRRRAAAPRRASGAGDLGRRRRLFSADRRPVRRRLRSGIETGDVADIFHEN